MSSREPRRGWVRRWLLGAVRPGTVVAELAPVEPELLPAVLLAIGSSALVLSGVFLAGGAVYHGFVEQYSTYLLERLTGSGLFGASPSRYAFGRVFLEGTVFVLKMWLVLALLVHGIGRALGVRRGFRQTLYWLAWSLFPWSWLLLVLAMASRLLRWLLPAAHGPLYFLGLGAVLLILTPLTLQRFWEAGRGAAETETGRLYGAYYGALLVLFLLWTWNHPALYLLRVL